MSSPLFQPHTSDDAYLQLLTAHGPKEWAENPEKHPKVFGIYRKIITNILNHKKMSKEGVAASALKPQKVFFTTSSPKIAMDDQHLQKQNDIPTPPGLPQPETTVATLATTMGAAIGPGRPRKSPLSLLSWRPIGGNSKFENESSTLSPAPTPPITVDHIPFLLDSLRHAMIAIEELQKNMDCTSLREEKIDESPTHSTEDKQAPKGLLPIAGSQMPQLPAKIKRKAPSADGNDEEESQSEAFVYGVPITSQ